MGLCEYSSKISTPEDLVTRNTWPFTHEHVTIWMNEWSKPSDKIYPTEASSDLKRTRTDSSIWEYLNTCIPRTPESQPGRQKSEVWLLDALQGHHSGEQGRRTVRAPRPLSHSCTPSARHSGNWAQQVLTLTAWREQTLSGPLTSKWKPSWVSFLSTQGSFISCQTG